MNKTIIYIKPGFCVAVGIGIMILPLKLVIAWIVAALIHELGHIICIRLFGIRVVSISVGLEGVQIITDELTWAQECSVALSGPAAGLSLLLLSRFIPTIALFAFFQSVYNLLPVYPLDGGRVALCIIISLFPNIGLKIYKLILFGLFVLLISLLFVFAASNWIMVIPVLILLLKVKCTCKHSLVAVQ